MWLTPMLEYMVTGERRLKLHVLSTDKPMYTETMVTRRKNVIFGMVLPSGLCLVYDHEEHNWLGTVND